MTRDLFDLPAEPIDAVTNRLLARNPARITEFDAFRPVVADHLLNALIRRVRRSAEAEPLRSVEDAKAVAVVLRVLTRPEWSQRDLDEYAAYWRTAWQSELFGYEFEAVRHRVQEAVAKAREVFPDRDRDV